jgi:NAD(P)-dependent dehydrogenase (short-subunit alcohol dehydrogenase family)
MASEQPRSILITGAARGIGRATAELFLARGWRVGLADVDEAAVTQAAGDRDRAEAFALDVGDPAQWDAVLQQFCGDGGLDALVNNAGVLASGPFATTPPDVHRRMVEVNVLGVANGCTQAYPYLRRGRRPVVVNLCSASALYGQPGLATYGATKAAVKSLTEALELEWAADGIRVRDLLPLFVDTEMVSRDAQRASSVGRLGVRLTAQDVAQVAWRAVQGRRVPLRGPHRLVGAQIKLMAAAGAVSPDWATRLVVRRTAV